MPLFVTFLGATLGAALGAGLELLGYDQQTCLIAVVAALTAYVLTWMLVEDRLKHRRVSKRPAAQ